MKLAFALPLSALALLLAACGDSSSSNGGGRGGGAGGGNGGAATRPAPGAPPAAAMGIFSYAHVQKNGAAAQGKVAAVFYAQPQSLVSSSSWADTFSGWSSAPLDGCASLPQYMAGSGSQPMTADAGMLTLTGPDGAPHAIPAIGFAGLVAYSGDVPAEAFAPLGQYTVSTSGAAIAAFSGDFWSPGSLTVSAPAPAPSGLLAVDTSKPLDVAWSGGPSDGPVIVQLTQKDKAAVTCRLTDDGAFTIPPSALTSFQPSASVERAPGDPAIDSMTVLRTSWYAIGEGPTTTVVVATSGATYDVSFQ